MTSVIFVHGLANKPPADYLLALWNRKLAQDDGPDLVTDGVHTVMNYWADVLYSTPDTNLASYELGALDEEALLTHFDSGLSALRHRSDPRFAALAHRLGLDPGRAPREPTHEEVQEVRQERVPVPAWLRNRVMERFARDAHHYFFNVEFSPRPGERYRVGDELRRRFVDALIDASKTGAQFVVSHSMGTIIAYDCLVNVPDCPPIDGLMTIGSPLGLDEVQDFFPAWTRANGFPSSKLRGRWVNVFDRLDPVAGLDPEIANDFQRQGGRVVEDLDEPNWGTWRHAISKYLHGPTLRARLAEMVGISWPS